MIYMLIGRKNPLHAFPAAMNCRKESRRAAIAQESQPGTSGYPPNARGSQSRFRRNPNRKRGILFPDASSPSATT